MSFDDTADEVFSVMTMRFMFGLFIDFMIVTLFALMLSDGERFWQTFVVLLGIHFALRIYIAFRNWIHSCLWCKLFGKNFIREQVYKMLMAGKFPKPRKDYDTHVYYFSKSVAWNEYVESETRVIATMLFMMLKGFRLQMSKTELSIIETAANEGLRDWSRQVGFR